MWEYAQNDTKAAGENRILNKGNNLVEGPGNKGGRVMHYKKVVAAILTAAMVMTSGGSVFAAETAAQETGEEVFFEETDEESAEEVLGTELEADGAVAEAEDGLTEAEAAEETVSEDEALASFSFTEYSGYQEGAYAKWAPVAGADGYQVYVSKTSGSWGDPIDDELIRGYEDYLRADALGLTAGTWYIKAVAVTTDDNKKVTGTVAESEVASVTVSAHDRSGFAWVSGTSSGAYNEDGSLKDNAVVLYVTNDTMNTVSADIVVGSSNKTTSCTGIMQIMLALKKGKETRPIDVRLIGQVGEAYNTTANDTISATVGSLDSDTNFKGDWCFDTSNNDTGITIEGVGDDAVAFGWGLRLKKASNVEVRNIGFLYCNSAEGDSVGLQQDNDHIWVHNCDMFYGAPGNDADQVKGDGALDCKKSTYVTFSYNHFWDNGKCNLLGLSEGTTSDLYITYHHNWYDHSDSRHPRIRYYSAHVYNNYYDGNAKYGAGSTLGSSVFMENNYFRNCKYPMLTSMQGSDVYGTSTDRDPANNGTFSKEAGGTIKAYGNVMTGTYTFIPYGCSEYVLKGTKTSYNLGTESTADFDAYVVENRNDTVPSTVKSYLGDNTYNNFDTASGMYSYTADSAEDAKDKVVKYAGRYNGGDISYTFSSDADTSYAIDPDLQSIVVGYQTSVKTIGGLNVVTASIPDGSSSGGSSSSIKAIGTETVIYDATEDCADGSADGTEYFEVAGSANSSSGTSATYEGKTYSGKPLKVDSNGSVTFTTTTEKSTLVVLMDSSANAIRKLYLTKGDAQTRYQASGAIVTVSDLSNGTYTISKSDGFLLYAVYVIPEGSVVQVPMTGLSLSYTSKTMTVGGSLQLVATAEPANTTDDKTVTWSSSDTSIAKVSDTGRVTAIAKGTATITATSTANTSLKAACEITVNEAGTTVKVTKVSLNKTSLSLKTGESSTLTASVEPTNATVKSVTWSSSDTSVATVNTNGKVTAVAKGSATITVTSDENSSLKAECKVTVSDSGSGEGGSEEGGSEEGGKGDDYYAVSKVTASTDISGNAVSENAVVVSLSVPKKNIYTSKAIKPAVIVSINGVVLTEKTDYKLSYKNNKLTSVDKDGNSTIQKENKKPMITIKLAGQYKKVKFAKNANVVNFDIQPMDLSSVSVNATLAKNIKKIKTVSSNKAVKTVAVKNVVMDPAKGAKGIKDLKLNAKKDIESIRYIKAEFNEAGEFVKTSGELLECTQLTPGESYGIVVTGMGKFYGSTSSTSPIAFLTVPTE